MGSPDYDLICKDLSFQYSGERVLSYPEIRIEKGSHWLINGPSGSGKTTLLNMIAGLLKPTNGSVLFNGTDIYSLGSSELDHFRGQNLGIVFQTPRFFSALSVFQNLLIPNYLAGKKQDKERANYLLESLGLKGNEKKRTDELSQGELQRLSLARALMNNPEILIADEPSSSLDDRNCDELIHLLEKEANEFGTTLIIVSHDARLKQKFNNQISLS